MSVIMAQDKRLERKIVTIEKRLCVMERFLQIRFCESFRDFSARDLSATTDSCEDISPKPSETKTAGIERVKRVVTSVDRSEIEEAGANNDDDGSNRDSSEVVSTYRTRSGRKSKRFTASALSAMSNESKKSKPSSSVLRNDKAPSLSNNKVLKVTVTRLKLDSKDTEETGETPSSADNLDTVDVKVNYDTEEDEPRNVNDDDYFTFPSIFGQEIGNEVTIENEVSEIAAAGDDEADDDDPMNDNGNDGANADDGDWNPSSVENENNDDDSEQGENERKAKPTKIVQKKTKVGKTDRKKYDVPSRRDLIPDGVTLQAVGPNQNKLKECPFCHQHWKPELFDTHVTKHIKERHMKCSYCDQRFFKRQALQYHEKLHQPDQFKVKCRLCDKLFIYKWRSLEHERICIRKHLEEDKYVDPAVIEDVRQRSKQVDLKWPDGKKQILPKGMKQCLHCQRLIAEDLLLKHLKEFHANWKCSFCENTFVRKNGLVRHLCRTHGNNCITCKLCKKTFESSSAIRAHNEQCRKNHKTSSGMEAQGKQEILETTQQEKQKGAQQSEQSEQEEDCVIIDET